MEIHEEIMYCFISNKKKEKALNNDKISIINNNKMHVSLCAKLTHRQRWQKMLNRHSWRHNNKKYNNS